MPEEASKPAKVSVPVYDDSALARLVEVERQVARINKILRNHAIGE